MKNEAQDNLMVRYLLGDLPETEQAALEERCFADSDVFDRMWETENQLVDEYVRGRLSPVDRARFEEHYLASPLHHRRVATARNLLAAADEPVRTYNAPEIRLSFLEKLTSWLRLSPAWQFAMASAMLLLLAGGVWLLIERARMRGELAKLQLDNDLRQNRESALDRQVAEGQSERNQLLTELDRLRKQQSEQRPVESSAPRSLLRIFSFALSPISVRGSATQPLAIPPDAAQVRLQLTLPAGDWKSFQAVIQTAERDTVWGRRNLKSRAGQVIINVPAAKLPFNDYILTLSGVTRAGETEAINRYSFRVIRN